MKKFFRKFKRGEKGFTLIELLIVVAILGVLAAVVVPQVTRFLGRGETEAQAAELQSVQTSVVNMMVDQGLAVLTAARVDATNDMTAFPTAAGGDEVLFGSTFGGGTNYVLSATTAYSYISTAAGIVSQS